MHGALSRLFRAALPAAAVAVAVSNAHGAIWEGVAYRVSGVWVGGAAGAGATSSRNSVASAGQPAVGPRRFTASYFLRPGFLQVFGSGSPGGGSDPAADQSFAFSLPSGCVEVDVPAGCFDAPYALSAVVPGFLPDASSPVSQVRPTGVALELLVSPTMVPRKALAVTACYRDQDVAGAVESRLKLAYRSGTEDAWVLLPSSVDAAQNRASAAAARLGLWRLLETVPSEAVGGAVAYPNPMTPGRTPMTFSRLTAGARLRVYDFSGAQVRELQADDVGQAVWAGDNAAGERVASGTYFVYIEGAGGERTLKVQVQR